MVRMGSMRRAKRILLIAGVLVLSVGSTQAGLFHRRKAGAKPAAAVEAAAMTLNAIDVESSPSPRLVLRTSGSPVFNSYSPQPNQFIIDLTGAAKGASLTIPSNLPTSLRSVTAEEVTEMGTRLTRVTVILADPATLQASAEMNAVNVTLPAPAMAAAVEVKREEPLPAVTPASAPAPIEAHAVPEPAKQEPVVEKPRKAAKRARK